MTLEQAKRLYVGQTVYAVGNYNADGSAMRCRINGVPKIWKTQPGRVKVPFKHGMYDNGYIDENNLGSFVLKEPKPLSRKTAKAKPKRIGR